MKTLKTAIFFLMALLVSSCEQSTPDASQSSGISDKDSNGTVELGGDSISNIDKAKIWKEISFRLKDFKIPSKIKCFNINDSAYYELSKSQISALLPKEAITQKDPLVFALHNLKTDTLVIGTFYYIQYPVVYDELYDTTCEIILILYNEEGIYTDYKTLAINEYGSGYSNFKSLDEILYLYSSEMETIETDIRTYSVKSKHTIEEVNKVHFSSKGSQQEYDRNNATIEKYMN